MKLSYVIGMKLPLWEAATEGTPAATPTPTTPTPTEASLIDGQPPVTPEGGEPKAGEAPKEGEGKAAEGELTPLTADDITIPEGFEVPEETMTSFLGIMNNAELTPAARAAALIELQAQTMTASQEAAATANKTLWDETQTTWRTEAQALPEIGGAKLPETLATIKKGLETVGADKATFDAFNLTGAGNHPAIIKVLHALTKPLAEGGNVSGSPAKSELSQADRLFGGQKE